MNCGLSVAEHEILHRELRKLPDTPPPREVWQRIETQASAEGLFVKHRHFEKLKWMSGAAIAAAVALLALNMPLQSPSVGTQVGVTEPELMDDGERMPRDLNALKVESQLLERNLRLLPQPPTVMKVSTATTIRDLEERIAAIDYRLNDRSVAMSREQEEIYWRERVRLMNLLVQMRYAQAHRTSF